MRPGRPALPHALLVGLVAAAMTWAALTSWHVFVVDAADFLVPLVMCGVIVGGSGAVLRRLDAPRVVVVLSQAVLLSAYVSLHLVGSAVPDGETFDALGQSLQSAVESARTYEAPVGTDVPPVTPLLLMGGAVFVLLVDLVACTLHRVPASGLALLAIYSVPAGLTASGPGWVAFLGAATGFLVLLHLDTRDHLLRWGRPLGPNDDSSWAYNNPLTDALRAGAGRIGFPATALALLVPLFVPVVNLDMLGFGPGDGDDQVHINNPRADLRRDLERGQDVPLLRVTTDDPQPDYLRIAALNRFTGVEWSSGDRAASSEFGARGALPGPAGVSPTVPRTTYDYQVDVGDEFRSTWLPTQFPASSVTAEGDWRYDPDSMDFMAFNEDDDELDTSGLSYDMTALELDYGTDGTYFGNARPGAVDDEVLEVPGGLPSAVRTYALQVTQDATNDYEAALLLQRWFRKDGGFRYDLDRAPEGTGGATFETFLNEGPGGRVGYCEQFASAMAAMARVLGIPARVAVGFLEPDLVGDDVYEYSSHDLHAWPELFFSGAGWVRFEPTPSGLSETSPPDYSRVPVENAEINEPSTGPGSEESDEPTGRPTQLLPPAPEDTATDDAADSEAAGSRWGMVLTVVVVSLLATALAVALLLTPRTARTGIRRRRLAGSPDDVWAELRATAIDLGVPWPAGRSPREIGAVLVEHMSGDAAPLDRVVVAVERARYARPGSFDSGELLEDGTACVEALEAAVTTGTRRRATWFPRSLWNRDLREAPAPRERVSADT